MGRNTADKATENVCNTCARHDERRPPMTRQGDRPKNTASGTTMRPPPERQAGKMKVLLCFAEKNAQAACRQDGSGPPPRKAFPKNVSYRGKKKGAGERPARLITAAQATSAEARISFSSRVRNFRSRYRKRPSTMVCTTFSRVA